MTLVDTCVWIDHFQRPDPLLARLLDAEEVLTHSFVIGELAAGTLRNRERTLAEMDILPLAPMAEELEVRALVESHSFWGLGIGWLDFHLLASALLGRATLLTYDKRLADAAKKLGVAFPVQ